MHMAAVASVRLNTLFEQKSLPTPEVPVKPSALAPILAQSNRKIATWSVRRALLTLLVQNRIALL